MTKEKSPYTTVLKNKLMFKKNRESKHVWFEERLHDILGSEGYHFLDSDSVQATLIEIDSVGINNSAHRNYSSVREIDFDAKCLNDIRVFSCLVDISDSEWVYIFPTTWPLIGGVLIKNEKFAERFNELSFVMDDDFDMYNENYDSSLIFRGDRLREDLNFISISLKGLHFKVLK